MAEQSLAFSPSIPVKASNAGLFISRGRGKHPDRVIDSYVLIFVRSGTLGIQEEDRTFEVRADQSLLLWPHRRHLGTTEYPLDLSFYWLHFFCTNTRQTQRPVLKIPQYSVVNRPDKLVELFRRFLDDQEAGWHNPPTNDLLAALILSEVAATTITPAGGGQGAILAGYAEAYIRTHFHVPVTTSLIAKELGCNPDYLGRLFHKVYGQTITEAIHKRRLQHARRLLLDGMGNIDQVARTCGFEDVAYFRRLFRRREGMTPTAYRRLYAHLHVNTE